MNLIECEFGCPFCGKRYITYVPKQYLDRITNSTENLASIIGFTDPTYREIFISYVCSTCQYPTFSSKRKSSYKDEDIDKFDVLANASSTEKEKLKIKISKMFENR